VARSSVVDAVADRLRGEILAGRLTPGTRLPSERELSLGLGVNRLTLRAALWSARSDWSRRHAPRSGHGCFIVARARGLDSLAALIGSLQPTDPTWFALACSMLEMRRIVATEAIALAALRTPMRISTRFKSSPTSRKCVFTIQSVCARRVCVRARESFELPKCRARARSQYVRSFPRRSA